MRTILEIARTLDLACLKPPVTQEKLDKIIQLAIQKQCASVCVPSSWSSYLVNALKNTKVRSCVVVGFPHGQSLSKVFEANWAADFGVQEVDFVVDFGKFLSGDLNFVARQIESIAKLDIKTKAILETCYLSHKQIRELGKLCVDSGVDWLKTSTGFGDYGATIEAVEDMLAVCKGSRCQVKASGGIKTPEVANIYLDMGCTRLGVGSLECLPNE